MEDYKMGTKRVGLARTQALIQNLKRELTMGGSSMLGIKKKTQAVTTSVTATAADSGKVYFVNAGTTVLTLPASATAGAGWHCKVILTDEPATSFAVTANGTELMGLITCDDGSVQSDANATFTINTSGNIGDWLEITCDGTSMYIRGNLDAAAAGAFS
jgi:alpha-D-ribose 1-methylphosphonate 5-triphosphate synthase subunit PhnH